MVSNSQSYGQEIKYKLEYVMVLLIVFTFINYTRFNWNNQHLIIFMVVWNINGKKKSNGNNNQYHVHCI